MSEDVDNMLALSDVNNRQYANSKLQRGFTLVEVLVVVALLGVLGIVVVASVSDAQKTARDAKRLNDVVQMSKAIDVYAATEISPDTAIAGCGSKAATVACTGIANIDFSSLSDPASRVRNPCSKQSRSVCQYSMTSLQPATVSRYEICFYLEQKNTLGRAGVYHIESGGVIKYGCSL